MGGSWGLCVCVCACEGGTGGGHKHRTVSKLSIVALDTLGGDDVHQLDRRDGERNFERVDALEELEGNNWVEEEAAQNRGIVRVGCDELSDEQRMNEKMNERGCAA